MKTLTTVLTALLISYANFSYSQLKIGLPVPGKDISAVTVVDEADDPGKIIQEDGEEVVLPKGTRYAQVSFGFHLISFGQTKKGESAGTYDTRKIRKLEYAGHVFVAIPTGPKKTEFGEIAMFNDKYYMLAIRSTSYVSFAVYDRKTHKKVAGSLQESITHNDKSEKGKSKEVKVRASYIKANSNYIKKQKLGTYFPECPNIESDMLKQIETGSNVLEGIVYKNCGKSKDIYSSWYDN